ncbi:MAG TPA: TauD/TfdA family dioxygenase [Bryobacteraceae bacterium]|nr:TauD/TfdA family dioxygenase [Bryobacteraceae bacterium]
MIPQVQAPLPVSLHPQASGRLRLSDRRREAWLNAALALEYPNYRDLDAWTEFRAATARLAAEHLPAGIHAALEQVFSPRGAEYLIIENLPVDTQLPPVPLDGMRPAQKQAVSEAVIAGLIGRRAEIFSYANEKSGSPIHEVAPVRGLELTQSNAGRTPMEYHTDGAFLPPRFRPHGLLLFGLLNVDTATLVLTAEQLMDAAPPDLLAVLEKPWYRHAHPASFSRDAASRPSPVLWRPILWRDENTTACVAAASSAIEPRNTTAHDALHEFRKLCSDLTPARIVIEPGTALLFRNDRVLHGRQAVSGSRWLQRAYFTSSLRPFREATHSDARDFCFDSQALLQS